MNYLDELARHLESHDDRKAATKAEAERAAAESRAMLDRVVVISREALVVHVEPVLQKVAKVLLAKGKDATVKHTENRNYDEFFRCQKEASASTISLETLDGKICELNFHAYVTDSSWKIVSSVVPDSLASRDFKAVAELSGTDVDRLAEWSEQRAIAFVKAVYP